MVFFLIAKSDFLLIYMTADQMIVRRAVKVCVILIYQDIKFVIR